MYERIKELMEIRGIKFDKDLEEDARVGRGTIRNIKSGHTPAHQTIVKIAYILGVTPEYLVYGTMDGLAADDERAKGKAEAMAILDSLSPAQQKAAIQYLRFLASTPEKE